MAGVSDLERRKQVSFDAFYFEKERAKKKSFSMKETFQHIMDVNLWGSEESVSGEGSTDRETQNLLKEIERLIEDYNFQTILDAPCGDFGWLSALDMTGRHYIGADILGHFIAEHQKRFQGQENYQFLQADITKDPLPQADVILCRDALVHFSFEDILKALKNFKASGSRYLLTTTFTQCQDNQDITTGDWRVLNFEQAPFNFPKPEKVITEGCLQNDDMYQDKSLGLWDLEKISL